MYVAVAGSSVSLEQPEDTRRFKVSAATGSDVDGALRANGWGEIEGDDALVSVEAIRRAAAGRVSDGWAADFQAMLDYARGKGWLTSDGMRIRAHVEVGG